jgi:hypothetical protein
MTALILLTILQAQAQPDANLPMRPTTFVVDDRISNGSIENFREIYAEESALVSQIGAAATPAEAPAPPLAEEDDTTATPADTGSDNPAVKPVVKPTTLSVLPVFNDSSSWAEVVINDIKVGVIGPLTNGSIHGIPSGNYDVQLTIMNGYSFTRSISTVDQIEPISPGGEGARPGLEAGEVPSWHSSDD